jgi:hypothetical protein
LPYKVLSGTVDRWLPLAAGIEMAEAETGIAYFSAFAIPVPGHNLPPLLEFAAAEIILAQ